MRTPFGVPAALVFPTVAGTRNSRIEELDAGTALLELMPNVLLTDAGVVQAHVDALGALVRSVPAFRLRTGTDLDAAVRLVTDVLDG